MTLYPDMQKFGLYAGHLNHSLFWKNLCPTKEYEPPSGDLKAALDKQFGGLDGLKKQFNPTAAALQVGAWSQCTALFI